MNPFTPFTSRMRAASAGVVLAVVTILFGQGIRTLLEFIATLRQSGLEPACTLRPTLSGWTEEIVRRWRFTRTNGISEGFQRKMKLIQRRAYGFRSFPNYRLRLIAQCS